MMKGLQTEPVYQDEYLQVALNRKLGFIATRWLRHPSSAEFRRAMTLSADYVCSEKCRYWLSDARKVHYMELADQNWLISVLIPRIAPYLERYARIMTEEGLTMLDMQRITEKIEEERLKDSVETRVELFLDQESALEWLLPEEEKPLPDTT